MKCHFPIRPSAPAGFALATVLIFLAISFLLLGSIMAWTASSANQTRRNNQYFQTLAAAESATEKAVARISSDFQKDGEIGVFNAINSSLYQLGVPTSAESDYWDNYQFSNGSNDVGQTAVWLDLSTRTNYVHLNSKYAGLMGTADTLRIQSYAKNINSSFDISAGIRQDIQVATVPLFQFAIFYNVDLEIEPGPDMDITGRVHGNADMYLFPAATLTFWSSATAHGNITTNFVSGDPNHSGGLGGAIKFKDEHAGGKSQLTLPIGTNNTPEAVYEILKMPPTGEDTESAMAMERYYNKADVIIKVSDPINPTNPPVITASSGLFDNFATTNIPANNFVTASTNTFKNVRENKKVNVVTLDVNKFGIWANSSTNVLRSTLNHSPNSVYIVDTRTSSVPAGTEPGIRVLNGNTANFPSAGLTVATPDPLYVQGDFNAPVLNSTNTSNSKPASFVADAITVLSTAWSDSANASANNKTAANTTINAAFLCGIVKTTTSSYSGGVENFPRFLENWSSKNFTYNGSMVAMFYSKIATGRWVGTGGYYNPPTRKWAFDFNFMDPNKLPPGTPQFRLLIRGNWASLGREPSS